MWRCEIRRGSRLNVREPQRKEGDEVCGCARYNEALLLT